MTQIKNFDEANEVLHGFTPSAADVKYNLDNMRVLMKELGNPQNTYKIIHIAGTSGKTSTCYYTAALLGIAGKKVGLTVSPHLDEVNERVQINLTPLPEAVFCKEVTEFLVILNTLSIKPSWFELVVAFAYWEFARQNVDYAVVEVGMGGLLDGTNVIDNPDKVCVITDIGCDHVQKLGKTLQEIAGQKAGIIHEGNTVIMHKQDEEVMNVVAAKAHDEHAELIMPDQNEHLAFIAMPYFQRRNWQLAFAAYKYIAARDGLGSLAENQIHASMRTVVPGRMETVVMNGKTIVMDGAHNTQKMKAFMDSFEREHPGRKAAILLSLKEDKEYELLLPLLQPLCRALFVTTFDVIQDLPIKSLQPEIVAGAARRLGFNNVQVIPDPLKAYRALRATDEEIQIITGSFYLLSCVRPLIL